MKGKSSVISGQWSVLGVLRLDAALPCGGSTPSRSARASLASRAQSGVKPPHSIVAMLGLVLFSSTTYAASTLVTSSVDGGGRRATSANYTIDSSVGGIGGISSAAPDTAKHGYIGQLSEVTGLSVTGIPVSVNEGATSQLSGSATLDDATVTALTGSDLSWLSPAFPIGSIDGSGVATISAVYQNTSGTFNGTYLGALGSGTLLVLDSNPDNYGSYAGDGIPDWWQAQYFGLNNPSAAPSNNVTGTGQNNLFKYVAGLDPTNPASVFVLKIANVTGLPNQKNLIYNPIANGRTYTVESRTNLVSDSYTALVGYNGPQTNGTQATVTDGNAVEAAKFYRVRISYP